MTPSYRDRSATNGCSICFRGHAERRLQRITGVGSKIASDVGHYLRLVSNELSLCRRCHHKIATGREEALRATLRHEISALGDGSPRVDPPRFVASEFATMLASWQIAPFPHPAVSRGFKLFNALCAHYPATDARNTTLAGLLERDLRHEVLAVFSLCEGTLVIDNLVSRLRGHGHAAHALRGVCALADECCASIVGVVEPNRYTGELPSGLSRDLLLPWYAREGFEVISSGDVVGVRREPRGAYRFTNANPPATEV